MKEEQVFIDILRNNNLRVTETRLDIFRLFLKTEQHVTVEQFHRLLRQKRKGVGYATVHRTLKLLALHGLAREVELGDRVSRFEHNLDHDHHDHLICIRCGKTIEFVSEDIERQQEMILKKHNFKPVAHRLEITGICNGCADSPG